MPAPLMSREERRKLIEQPFYTQVVPGKSWGGVNTGNAGRLPEEGHKTWHVAPFDESGLPQPKEVEDI